MIFEDPIGTLRVELPAGWAYNPFDSTLTDFVFVRWDRPEELIAVHVRRASIAADQPDEKWIEKVRSEIGEARPLINLTSNRDCAVAADFVSTRGSTQRVAFVRGPQVELVIEQRSAEPAAHAESSAQDLWDPLEKTVRTSSSDANLELQENCGPEDFNKSVEAANLAFEKNDDSEILNALQQSIKVGASAWLQSMASPGRALEVNAAVRVAQATVHLGLFTGNPFLLRDADFMLRRAQHSLEAAGLQDDWAQELGRQISETLQSIWSELLEKTEADNDPKMFPIVVLRERGFRLTQAAAKAFEVKDAEIACSFASAAVDDLLSLMAFLRSNRPQEIPQEITAHLVEHGITDQEGQRKAIQKAREALVFPVLNMAFQIRCCCALARQDPVGASETIAVQMPVAQQIFDENPEDAGIALNLALTIMDCAGSAALSGDMDKLDEAARHLDEAVRILDTIGDRRYSDDGWIRNHMRQMDGSLGAIDRSFQAAAQRGETRLEASLSALRGQFQNVAARFQEAVAKATPPPNQEFR